MKSSSRCLVILVFAALLVIMGNNPILADTYHTASFSGAMYSGPNVNPPFLGNGFEGGGPVSGSFVFDDNMIPGAGSGVVNVFFSTFPDIVKIPAATALTINLGTTPLTFTFADAMPGNPPGIIPSSAAIQYNNGNFNGFFFVTDFTFIDENQYEFTIQGGQWNIQQLVGGYPSGTNLVTGYINFSLTDVQPYTPPSVAPTIDLLLLD